MLNLTKKGDVTAMQEDNAFQRGLQEFLDGENEDTQEVTSVLETDRIKLALTILFLGLFAFAVFLYIGLHNKQVEKEAEEAKKYHVYESALEGVQNVLRGKYGDVAVTHEDWGNHQSYGYGDPFGQYLDEVTVHGVQQDEIVIVNYFNRSNGANLYSVAEPSMNIASNGWEISRDGDEVKFFPSGDAEGYYNAVGIFDPNTNTLYYPPYHGSENK